MPHRSVLVTLPLLSLIAHSSACVSSVQTATNTPPVVIETPTSTPATIPTQERQDEREIPQPLPHERKEAVIEIGTLRNAVRLTPDRAELRLELADRLYRIGDLDAALDECRAAIALNPDDAKGHVQLGVLLMAGQDWKSASASLKEAIRLDPELTQAHYNLGSAHYALGNVKAAVQSYRQTIALQPHFPDARYRLALLLKLTNREPEAAQFLEEAAIGGVPQAQYFLGNAYKQGQGVEKNLSQAISWWAKAAELGHQPASDILSKLRRQAFATDQPERRRQEALDAFRRYRIQLWADYPDLTRSDPDESLGVTLLQHNQTVSGITALMAEAYALSEPAQAELARLYETGLDSGLAQYDRRILACFETTAGEGFPPAKKALARIYAKGLGVAANRAKAQASIKGLPRQDAQTLSDELGLR